MGDKFQAALHYADLGFKVFPCKPMSKEPAVIHGFKQATTDGPQITTWWDRDPEYNVAIATAGYLVIDIDGPLTAEWPREPLIGTGYLTPRGSHLWLKLIGAQAWRNTTKKLAPNVDTRGWGGYAIVPPSETPDGKYLLRVGDPFEPPESLVPGWLAAEMDALNGIKTPDDFLRGDRPIPDGQQNSTLTQIGGWLRRHGFSQEQIEATLLKVSEDRCVDANGKPWPHPEDRVKKIAQSVARYEPDITAVGAMEGVEIEPDDEPVAASYPDPGEMPEELIFNLPGLGEKIIEYTLKTAPCPQPVYALAGAMALLSTITGRKIEDHSKTRTNLLCVILGKTGSGKDRPRQVNRRLLTDTGCDYLGPEEAVSGNGIYTSIRTRPTVLLQWDEMGLLFKQIASGRADGPLANARAILMKLYHSSAETIQGGGYADPKRNFELIQPHLVLLGSTIVENFAAGLSREQLTDGFMSRFSVFPSDDCPFPGDPQITEIPAGVLDEIMLWRDFFKDRGNLMEENPVPRVLHYTEPAWEELKAFRKWLHEKPDREMWIRAYIQAKKSAILYQASNVGPAVTEIPLIAVEWGIELVTYQVKKTLYLADQFIADSQFEADQLEFGRWMHGIRKCTLMKVAQSKFRKWKAPYRQEVMDALVHQEKLHIITCKGITRPTTILTWKVR